jgi:hypothetical protein
MTVSPAAAAATVPMAAQIADSAATRNRTRDGVAPVSRNAQKHGMNLQVIASPDGSVPCVSGALHWSVSDKKTVSNVA